MTVGEKIQFYRKKLGMSQEELGQKMLVSRQTVSLWEMDKTLPTVDNLLLLKEIFSVSIDHILNGDEPKEEPVEEKAPPPNEAYVFKYEKADLREVFKKSCFPLIKNAVIFSLACAALFVFLATVEANGTIWGLLLGYSLLGVISHIKGFFAYRKAWKANENKILESTYSYEIFEGYFALNISRNGEIMRTLKCYFDDIEKIQSFGNYLVLQISGQSYIINKDALIPDSAFITFCGNQASKNEMKKPKDTLKAVSILLVVLSICAIWGALLGVAILSEINQMMTENMWVFFLFLPIPIASVAFGFYLKKKGYKYKMNVIAGLIMAGLLCIYGSFTFFFAGVFSHGDEPILQAEQLLHMDFPAHSRINTQDWTRGTQSVTRGYIFSTSDVYFEDAAVEEFEKALPSDARWLSGIPNDLIGITSYFCEMQAGDYYIIYNRDTGEWNQLPSEGGTYRFINVLYHAESNTMKLVEYQIEYTK